MSSNKRNSNYLYLAIVFVCLIIIIIIILWVLLKGETKTNKQEVHIGSNIALSCKNIGNLYPFFSYNNSNNRETRIDIIFDNNSLNAISLKHTLYYNDENLVKQSDNYNHGNMNISFQNRGLDINILAPSYSQQKDKYIMTLYATNDTLNTELGKYFLLENYDINLSIDDYVYNYQQQGFTCDVLNK